MEFVKDPKVVKFMRENPELTYAQITGKKSAELAGFPNGRPKPPSKAYVESRIKALDDLKRRVPADVFMKECGFYLTYAFAKHPEVFDEVPIETWRRIAVSPFVLKVWKQRRAEAGETASAESACA